MAFLAKVGSFSAALKIDGKTFVADPKKTNLRNPLPIVTTAMDCSANPLQRASTDGRRCVARTCANAARRGQPAARRPQRWRLRRQDCRCVRV